MTYIPQPLDTSQIELDENLTKLVERLSENVHDVWAQGRLEQGWCYGPEYDGEKKLHPCLVPYQSLPESEKSFDRNTVLGTVKGMLLLGAEIRLSTKTPERREVL